MLKLPQELITAVLDRLEPEELITLHRTTKEFRQRIGRRGFLPGRVQALHIHGRTVAKVKKNEKVVLKTCEFGVESREGTLILANNHHNGIFHLLGKT
ncbi:unnamed protein product, partial [Mesorhabditis spiculigera]